MNITLIGTKIVQDTKFLAFEKNNGVDVINVIVDTDESWTYKLDVKYPEKCCTGEELFNIIDLPMDANRTCTIDVTADMVPFTGKYTMQLRGISGEQVYHSDVFDCWVKYSIEPGSTYNPVPSEFYQIEQNITEINNHPPYPDISGFWMIWNSQTNKYELSDIPAVTASDIGAIPVPTTAEVGQTIVVKAVDENGKPTEWEPVTLPEQVQADWNQNDSSAADYVKNRPFYRKTINMTVENATDEVLEGFPVFAVGDTVTVNVDGVEHSLVAYDDFGVTTIGDTYESLENGEGQLGWKICVGGEEVWFYSLEAHTVSYLGNYYHKIDEKYLPETLMKSEYAAYVMPCINANLVKDLTYFSDVIADTTYTADCNASEWELLMSIIKQANNSLIVYATSRLVVQVSSINKNNLIIYGSRYIDGVQKINKTNLQFDETSETLTVTQYAKTL